MVDLWRKTWSKVPGTTDPLAPFGIVTLASGGSEGGADIGGMRWSQTANYGYWDDAKGFASKKDPTNYAPGKGADGKLRVPLKNIQTTLTSLFSFHMKTQSMMMKVKRNLKLQKQNK